MCGQYLIRQRRQHFIHSTTVEYQAKGTLRNLRIRLIGVLQSSARINAKVCTWNRVNTSQRVNCLNRTLVEKDLGHLGNTSQTNSHQGALITSGRNCITCCVRRSVARGRREVTPPFSSDVEAKGCFDTSLQLFEG